MNVLLQPLLFVLVGVANTMIDFGLYNLLAGKICRWPRILANVLSVSVAMALSFSANALVVFAPARLPVADQVFRFALVTAVSLYVVQNLVIYCLTFVWLRPAQIALGVARRLHVGFEDEDLVNRNVAKLAATGLSLTWNFLWYKFYVFA